MNDPDLDGVEDLLEYLAILEGFGLFLITVPNGKLGRKLQDFLHRHLRERGDAPAELSVVDPYGQGAGAISLASLEHLVRTVGEPLLRGQLSAAPGAPVLIDASRSTPLDASAWAQLFAWLNRNRDSIARASPGPLLLVMLPNLYVAFAKNAPDFWSIRRDVLNLGRAPPWEDLVRKIPPLPPLAHQPALQPFIDRAERAIASGDRDALEALSAEAAVSSQDARRADHKSLVILRDLLTRASSAELDDALRALDPKLRAMLPPPHAPHAARVEALIDLLNTTGQIEAFLASFGASSGPRFFSQKTNPNALKGMPAPKAQPGRGDLAHRALWRSEVELRLGNLSRALGMLIEARGGLDPAGSDGALRALIDERIARVRGLSGELARLGAPVSEALSNLGAERSEAETLELAGIVRELQGHHDLVTMDEAPTPPPPRSVRVDLSPLIVLSSFNPDEALPGMRHALRLYAPATDPDRGGWEARFGEALLVYRERLRADGVRAVQVWPRCTLSVAARFGMVFHQGSGFSVLCHQIDEARGGISAWDLDQAPATDAPPAIFAVRPPEATELDLLLAVNWDIQRAWSEWRFRNPGQVAQLVLRSKADGPRWLGPSEVSAYAAMARQLLSETPDIRTVRLAISGPAGLAVAVGRALPPGLTVHLMDHTSDGYQLSFTCQSGV